MWLISLFMRMVAVSKAGEMGLGSDAAGDRVSDVLAGVRDQLADIASLLKKQAALRVDAQAADGAVQVTVDALGQLVKAVIDKSYLDDHDFDDLGGYIAEAAQAAARDAGRRVAAMLGPINERHKSFPSYSDIVEGGPGLDYYSGMLKRAADLFGDSDGV
jgi:DNA-binding protein YbaB